MPLNGFFYRLPDLIFDLIFNLIDHFVQIRYQASTVNLLQRVILKNLFSFSFIFYLL